MRNVPSLPWWLWALIAFFVLRVLVGMDVGIFIPVLIGLFAAGAFGQRRRGVAGGKPEVGPPPAGQPLPPEWSSPPSTQGWAGGGAPSTSPTDPAASGSSPWVRGADHPSQAGPGDGPGSGAGTGMPRIEVPQYPHGSAGPTAYPPVGASPSTDPVVSLGQLHLSRCSRDLHTAATAGSSADVARVLAEVDDQAGRLLVQLGGAGALPGSGRREFEAGLRRLQRDVQAARGEDPPGSRVARVVQAAGRMGDTGRYE